MSLRKKLHIWHLTPLALVALIVVAVIIWIGRGDFSTRDITVRLDGPVQIENGQEADFKIIVENNSAREIQDINLFLELPPSLILQAGANELSTHFINIGAGEKQEEEFKIVASSTKEKETIRARLDYSPADIEARFASIATHEVVIGSLDVSVVFDLPENTFAGQELGGVMHVVANSDIQNFEVFARLVAPNGFNIKSSTPGFENDNIWKLGKLIREQDIKLEFSGVLTPRQNISTFALQVGKLSGGEFLPLKVAERSVESSSSAVTLQARITRPSYGFVLPGDNVGVQLEYFNKSDTRLENAEIRVVFPTEFINPSSIDVSGGINSNGAIIWDGVNTSQLRSIEAGERGTLDFSFIVRGDLIPEDINDTNKFITLRTSFSAGEDFSTQTETSLRLGTQLNFSSVVLRNGSSLGNSGPIPPKVGELTTYAVRWSIENSFNRVKNARVEVVLPLYASWQGVFAPSNENIWYNSATNTVIWEPGTLDVGLGTIISARSVEFKIGITPRNEHRGEIINILEYTQFTGTDVFTDQFIERDYGEMRTVLPDDPTIGIGDGVVQ